jgi:hypothetical protein
MTLGGRSRCGALGAWGSGWGGWGGRGGRARRGGIRAGADGTPAWHPETVAGPGSVR